MNWKPAIIVPEGKKRQRRVERLITRLGMPWGSVRYYSDGETSCLKYGGDIKPVD